MLMMGLMQLILFLSKTDSLNLKLNHFKYLVKYGKLGFQASASKFQNLIIASRLFLFKLIARESQYLETSIARNLC